MLLCFFGSFLFCPCIALFCPALRPLRPPMSFVGFIGRKKLALFQSSEHGCSQKESSLPISSFHWKESNFHPSWTFSRWGNHQNAWCLFSCFSLNSPKTDPKQGTGEAFVLTFCDQTPGWRSLTFVLWFPLKPTAKRVPTKAAATSKKWCSRWFPSDKHERKKRTRCTLYVSM